MEGAGAVFANREGVAVKRGCTLGRVINQTRKPDGMGIIAPAS